MSQVKGVKAVAKQVAIVATKEIAEIQRNFAAMRDLGVVTSPYPQTVLCPALGVLVREIRLPMLMAIPGRAANQ